MEQAAHPATLSTLELLLRLGGATLLGMVLGLDRELRGFSAGIRTHGILALAAAMVVISGMMLHQMVRAAGGDADPLRTVQGMYQALGFIGAGLVFTRRGGVHNLTSAGSIILAVAIGIAGGLGQWALACIATALGLCVLSLVRVAERWLPGNTKARHD
ncbi:MgtC/SapB family protein [Roseomonas marmotae]|uniref:Protein MgtC n=1 Tax=Roseomonas marmotae TaxID=2768161 RepID=A0ABS3K6J4_9PROT|nr:MgtC/SapB family protein [Roseomonas marmotae]MBO1073074.1 MgtC/SapB family protein [Roseomonas marmotae]QTI79283.1 MgtC/SapB family protein [Roseomonas marmotae]